MDTNHIEHTNQPIIEVPCHPYIDRWFPAVIKLSPFKAESRCIVTGTHISWYADKICGSTIYIRLAS